MMSYVRQVCHQLPVSALGADDSPWNGSVLQLMQLPVIYAVPPWVI